MSQLTLITGGTSGIGAEFAAQLAAKGSNLVLVARDQQRLDAKADELRTRFGIEVETLEADLATEEGLAAVVARVNDTERPIDMLINNAGFGSKGSFLDNPASVHEEMLHVNGRAVLTLTHAALSQFVPRDSGGVLNVSSVAGYTPGYRSSATYGATKAFVTAITEGLAPSLEGTGVKISALCPGFVRSNFHKRAGIDMTKMPKILWLEPDDVVRDGLRGYEAGEVIIVPSIQYKLVVLATRLLPRVIVRRTFKIIGNKTSRKAAEGH